MPRPTLLVAEPEAPEALSVRKLVLETNKFNVLTAHSSKEALDIFSLFPKISAAVLVGEDGIDCNKVASDIKKANASLPIVYLHAHLGGYCKGADQHLSSHEPDELVEFLRSLLGDPRKLKRESSQ